MPYSLAYFIESFYPNIGGSEKRAMSLLSRLHNFSVNVFTINFDNSGKNDYVNNITINRIMDSKKREYFTQGGRNIIKAMEYASRVRRVVKEQRFDLYIFDQFPYFHYSKSINYLPGDKVLVQMHEVLKNYYHNFLLNYTLSYYEGKMARNRGGVIATSNFNKRKISSEYGIPGNGIEVISNGIDFIDDSDKADRKKIIFVGRNTPDKRIPVIFEIARKMKEYDFTIVTDDGSFSNIPENVAVRVGLSDDDIRKEYRSSSIFLTASYREGFSIASLEAMGFSLPVLYIRSPFNMAMEEIVRDGYNGFSCTGIDDVVSKIREMEDVRRYRELSRNAYNFAHERMWDNIARQYESYLIDKIEGK